MKKIFTLAIALVAMVGVANAQTDENDGWTSLGMGTYRDVFIPYLIRDYSETTYEVEIQEKDDQPGLYRLVNPYGENFPYNAGRTGAWDDSQNYYMEINACDPDGVYIPQFSTGMTWGDSYGEFLIGSWADVYMQGNVSLGPNAWNPYIGEGSHTLEEAKAEGLCGVFKDGIITFPPRNQNIYDYPEYTLMCKLTAAGSDWRNCTYSGDFVVALPGVDPNGALEKWVTLGDYDYTDDFIPALYANRTPITYSVEVQESDTRAGVYRLVNPYGAAYPYSEEGDYDTLEDHYMVIDASDPDRVFIERCYTGTDYGYGELVFWSYADYFGAEEAEANGYYGKLVDGVITFPANTLIAQEGDDYRYRATANEDGAFKLVLPNWESLGYCPYTEDFIASSTTQTLPQVCTYEVEVEEDMNYPGIYRLVNPYALVYPYEATVGAFDAYLYINAMDPEGVFVLKSETALNRGYGYYICWSVADQNMKENGSTLEREKILGNCGTMVEGVITFPENSLLVVESGELPWYDTANIHGGFKLVLPYESDGWKSWGKCEYTEDIMTGLKGNTDLTKWDDIDVITYQVEIQEREDEPGLYRLVNPYGAAYPYNEPGDWDDTQDYYMIINACDPDGVYMEKFLTGLDWGWGAIYMWSWANYFMQEQAFSVDDAKSMGLCGTLKNGVITFPHDGLLISMPGWWSNGDGLDSAWTMVNYHDAFKIVLPVAAGISQTPATESSASVLLANGKAYISGLTAGAMVYVYTTTGQQVGCVKAGADGNATVDLASQKKGAIYMLRTPDKTFKVVYN